MQNGSNASIYQTLPVRFSIPRPVSHLMLEAVTPSLRFPFCVSFKSKKYDMEPKTACF